ncbi:PREDICTED: dnaJ homolog subfamily C member 12-like isoform X1 [Acropora digitifera]|uniref:dnaJ homolog subfamily C member 12-like isoform X1 n=1 Tax=Acropora digitifera TaxID=70779 RepID=UPI00077A0185|nr:PREDICTED: dnaJ homolog subfamily C member 12-like isoform X1 [Acropora digitifera]
MDDFCDALLNKVKQDDFYTLLGCDELATPGQINAEFRQKAKLLHPDKNRGDRTTEKLFERLKYARNVLCDEESRKKYDHWRSSGIAIPYEQWIELSGAVHTSLHWAAKPRKELMVDYKKADDSISSLLSEDGKTRQRFQETVDMLHSARTPIRRCGWRFKRGSHLSKFRRYEI